MKNSISEGGHDSRNTPFDWQNCLQSNTAEFRSLTSTQLPDCLQRRSDGAIVVRGHRIKLYLILVCYFDGATQEDIQEEFPSLEPSVINEVFTFCRTDRSLCRQYHDEQKYVEEQSEAKAAPSLDDLRRRSTDKEKP